MPQELRKSNYSKRKEWKSNINNNFIKKINFMTSKDLQKKVTALIDEHCMELSISEYIDAMQAISSDTQSRADAAKEDEQRELES